MVDKKELGRLLDISSLLYIRRERYLKEKEALNKSRLNTIRDKVSGVYTKQALEYKISNKIYGVIDKYLNLSKFTFPSFENHPYYHGNFSFESIYRALPSDLNKPANKIEEFARKVVFENRSELRHTVSLALKEVKSIRKMCIKLKLRDKFRNQIDDLIFKLHLMLRYFDIKRKNKKGEIIYYIDSV